MPKTVNGSDASQELGSHVKIEKPGRGHQCARPVVRALPPGDQAGEDPERRRARRTCDERRLDVQPGRRSEEHQRERGRGRDGQRPEPEQREAEPAAHGELRRERGERGVPTGRPCG